MNKKPAFDVGDRIIVLQYSEYRGRYTNELGIVESVFKAKKNYVYGVKLDHHTNEASRKGLFWFEANHIKIDKNESEETFMFKDFVVAEVEFLSNPNSGRHTYALYDSSVEEGDTVVVSTGHHGFALAKVVTIDANEQRKAEVKCNREVVCKVDFSEFNARKDAVNRVIELKREMEIRIRKSQELTLYEALAEKDPTLKVMLDEYKNLMEYIQ